MRTSRYVVAAVVLLLSSCAPPPATESASSEDERALPEGLVEPNLDASGKADQPGAVTLLGAIAPGQLVDGAGAGWLGYTFAGKRGQRLTLQAFSSEWGVVYLHGPRRGADRGRVLSRVQTRVSKPGLEQRVLEQTLPADGEYTIVIGSTRRVPTDHLLFLQLP